MPNMDRDVGSRVHVASTPPARPKSTRPYAFLVSTTGCARGISRHLGSAAYSYAFVFEAFKPVLEQLGVWRLVDRPESSLAFAARRAEAEGFQPVHLAFHPLQDIYLTPAVPTLAFPFWEFPEIPTRDFGVDTRQNWLRISNAVDVVAAACEFTADAFRRAGARPPLHVVPVPLPDAYFDLPAWDPEHVWTLNCRHLTWGGEPDVVPADAAATASTRATKLEPEPDANVSPASWKRKLWNLGRRGFRAVYPWLSPAHVDRIGKLKTGLLALAGRGPASNPHEGPRSLGRRLYHAARSTYNALIRPWLSPGAVAGVTKLKVRLMRALGREPIVVIDPLLPSSELTLGGLVYTSVFNLGDRRKNETDLLTAFLLAFQNRPDVTLVLKLATNPTREHHEVNLLSHLYRSLGIRHRCRVVVITEFLSDERMAALMRVTSYYLNTSRAEGACLPLQQALAGGRPAVAPAHTAMSDFIDDAVAFVVDSHPEPTYWPHDPERRIETAWDRIVWSSLRDQLLASAAVVDRDPDRYRELAESARTRMRSYAARDVVARQLEAALAKLPDRPVGAFAWAS